MPNKPLLNEEQKAKLTRAVRDAKQNTFFNGGIIAFFLIIFAIGFVTFGWLMYMQWQSSNTSTQNNWKIPEFKVNMDIYQDGRTFITENIQADFSQEKHHGIFRYIPLYYNDDQNQKMDLGIYLQTIRDEIGKIWTYDQSYLQDSIYLKIGDANVYLNSLETYIIDYQVNHAIRYYKDHDEIYWNITGNDWPVAIEHTEASITLPKDLAEKDLKFTCFTGITGSKDQNCTHSIEKAEDGSQIFTFKADNLKTLEGLTVAVGFPKGVINEIAPVPYQSDSYYQGSSNGDNTPNWTMIFLEIFVLPFLLSIIYTILWFKNGRDPKADKTAIMPIYTPPADLTPAEIGALVKDYVEEKDLSATIVDLCVRGYMKIKELANHDFQFIKLKDFAKDNSLKDYERELLHSLFKDFDKRKLSSLKQHFSQSFAKIKKIIYENLIKKGFYDSSPEKIIDKFQGLGIAFIFFGIFFIAPVSLWISGSLILSGILSGIFAKIMPRKTKAGVNMRQQILGLEEYIKTAETDRIKFQEKENLFEKLLPYAMVLGLTDKWTKAFAGITTTPPEWYETTSSRSMVFSTDVFLSNLNVMSTSISATFSAPAPSHGSAFGGGGGGGGGSSGGGGGGGGGGAW
ncbi:MAG: DUF2207 domain-containing protein [Candidatus Gracilibacteria bacterium]|jgi:uncharacterized membrane protein